MFFRHLCKWVEGTLLDAAGDAVLSQVVCEALNEIIENLARAFVDMAEIMVRECSSSAFKGTNGIDRLPPLHVLLRLVCSQVDVVRFVIPEPSTKVDARPPRRFL